MDNPKFWWTAIDSVKRLFAVQPGKCPYVNPWFVSKTCNEKKLCWRKIFSLYVIK